MSEEPQAEGALEVEAAGETVGEAKWAALRELERLAPGLDRERVDFEVLSEGERGLLGVGFAPARVIARAERPRAVRSFAPDEPAPDKGSTAGRLHELLEHVRAGLSLDATVTVRERGETLVGTFHGRDLGLVIGKHGQTIDALQYLATAVVSRSAEHPVEVIVDAAGYRERRQATIESLADRTASRVEATGEPVALDPMTASERKIVHLRLREHQRVVTSSEGTEPNRHVVVSPSP